MTGRVEGKVAFITGVARGQGRSHAIRLAEEGADIIGVDLCAEVEGVPYAMATEDDLAETVEAVERLGRRIIATKVDVRDSAALSAAVSEAVAELGRLDIVSANAGISGPFHPADEMDAEAWQTMIDINLTGVFNTAKASIAHIKAGGRGGAITLTSSEAGLKAYGNAAHYVSAKHGVVGLMRTLALELAPFSIRVNSIHPTQVDTPMIMNDTTFALFCPGIDSPTREQFAPISQSLNALPVPWVDPVDISNALLFLSSDEARYITGVPLPVDAGCALL
ncbi:mycofactocin-coupled SDR family oxidoreductase [Rhodococcus qingshengii]|uniref:mycofactocin-coupled SDR family oxidoreductase n=1 Tax=Rhodococcus qingshengii TaxID=334542 RepID=UPI001E4F7BF2|nr:mycofactocin-coupled SDR family oxidoreductase [Rhodococcus qingshengii]MCQ4150584.1 mycofactocin-coupled SDR family oxidoreductase [Rhodococcus qingshengii]UGQ55428.1 mycofactocin-coupled SDR family oxidoreductase [Rhodococcus qingshengii]